MKNFYKMYYQLAVLFLGVVAPITASAQAPKLDNPLQTDSILCFVKDIIGALTYLAVPLIVLFIIISGFKFVTAGGSDEDLQEAKQMILYTVVGAAVILGANLIAEVLINTASSLGAEVGGATCS